jgi:hypothetical protein
MGQMGNLMIGVTQLKAKDCDLKSKLSSKNVCFAIDIFTKEKHKDVF